MNVFEYLLQMLVFYHGLTILYAWSSSPTPPTPLNVNAPLDNIMNSLQLVNLTYNKLIVQSVITLDQVHRVMHRHTFSRNDYTFIWQLNMDDDAESKVAYHPRFSMGSTAKDCDALMGNNFPSTLLKNIVQMVKKRPDDYQLFYLEFSWKPVETEQMYFVTYLPQSKKPIDMRTNPIYIIGSVVVN